MQRMMKVLTALAGSAMALAVSIGPASAATTPASAARSATVDTTTHVKPGDSTGYFWTYGYFPHTFIGLLGCQLEASALVKTGTDTIYEAWCTIDPTVIDLAVASWSPPPL